MYNHAIDEHRKSLSDLDTQKAQLEHELEKMLTAYHQEMDFVSAHPDLAMSFDSYRMKVATREAEITEHAIHLERQMAELSEHISLLFSELKKFEILRDRKEKLHHDAFLRSEQLLLDNISLDMTRRKSSSCT